MRSLVYTATAASTPLTFSAQYTQQNYPLGLDNVQVRAIQDSSSAQPAAARPAVHITSPSIAAGDKQVVQVSAGKRAALALVIDYPDGTQVVTPARTRADGTYTYSWTIAAGIHGTVQVTVVSAGNIAQGSFQVR